MTNVAYPANDLDLAGFTRTAPTIKPKIFELAADCPARASAVLLGQRALNVPVPDERPGTLLAWQTTVELIRLALRRGADARSAWADLPDASVPRPPALRAFALDAADAIIDEIGDDTEGRLVLEEASARIDATNVQLKGVILLRHRASGRVRLYRVRLGERLTEADDVDAHRWAVVAASTVAASQRDLTQVEVAEISLASGTVSAPRTWSRDELRSAWTGDIRPGLDALRRQPVHPRPGRHCATCEHAFACPAPHQAAGLLGIAGRPWRVDVSADTLRRYAACAHDYALGELYGIPGRRAGSAAADRGRAVHARLAAAHAIGRGCDAADLFGCAVDPPGDDPLPYLRAHIDHCPLRRDDVLDVAVEQPIVVVDGQANVVLLATVDLRYTSRDGARRWREVKTRPQAPDVTAEQLIEGDVTVATYVLLASSGVDGAVEQLEWEVLAPDRATVTTIPITAVLVGRARAVVASRVETLLDDTTWAPTDNGAHCVGCAFAEICPHSRAT